MCPEIDNPASCEICVVIHFLHTKIIGAVEIQRELCIIVYCHYVMIEEL
jgi:hypothetical protein